MVRDISIYYYIPAVRGIYRYIPDHEKYILVNPFDLRCQSGIYTYIGLAIYKHSYIYIHT